MHNFQVLLSNLAIAEFITTVSNNIFHQGKLSQRKLLLLSVVTIGVRG